MQKETNKIESWERAKVRISYTERPNIATKKIIQSKSMKKKTAENRTSQYLLNALSYLKVEMLSCLLNKHTRLELSLYTKKKKHQTNQQLLKQLMAWFEIYAIL